jgi:U3 small nucleolar RNA-associated protein 11
MTASFKNAAPQVTHRERGQLASRQRLGLLEKKKDYKLRAKNYHYKQKQLKGFREKAQFKNPDEFHFGMINAKIKVHIYLTIAVILSDLEFHTVARVGYILKRGSPLTRMLSS